MTTSRSWQERFWSKVEKTDGCWLWRGTVFTGGYGYFWLNGKNVIAPRLAWMLVNGEIASSKTCVCHHCDNPLCVRVDHLFLGTTGENNTDRNNKGRTFRHVGQLNGMSKLTDEEASRIRLLAGTMKQDDIADMFNVCRTLVSRILRGKIRGIAVYDHRHKIGCTRCLSEIPRTCDRCGSKFFSGRKGTKRCGRSCKIKRLEEA